jgi:hypothetical protein
MDRIYLAILVSAFLVLITAAGLLVTKTHILAHHRRTAWSVYEPSGRPAM